MVVADQAEVAGEAVKVVGDDKADMETVGVSFQFPDSLRDPRGGWLTSLQSQN